MSREQEIHNEDTQTSLLSAYDDPEETKKLQRLDDKKYRGNDPVRKKYRMRLNNMCIPWQCSRGGCSCRRCTAVRSVVAESHRRDME